MQVHNVRLARVGEVPDAYAMEDIGEGQALRVIPETRRMFVSTPGYQREGERRIQIRHEERNIEIRIVRPPLFPWWVKAAFVLGLAVVLFDYFVGVNEVGQLFLK